MEDIKLMEKCLNGQLDSFGSIYDRYIDKIYKFVYLKTSNKEVAEDIVSDVFISALNNVKSFRIDDSSSVKSWLYKIAYNKVIDFYKKNKQEEIIGDYLEMSIDESFSQNVDNKDRLKEVFLYLKGIKKEQRDIFIYRIWEDLSYKEIAEITGKSVDNCKQIVSRTLKVINANFILILFILMII